MCSAVVELTNFTIEQVYQMPAQDFFIYLEYINDRNFRETIKQRQQIAQQRAHMKSRRH